MDLDGGEVEKVRKVKEFKSVHIDREKKIYLLNGESMENATEVYLSFEHGRWSLQVNLMEEYQMQQPDDIKE